MNEVSCRALHVLLEAASKRPGATATLLQGIPHELKYLDDHKNRIDWDVWCDILANAQKLWTLQELSALNEQFSRSPMFSTVGAVAGVLFSARDLFDWICKRSVGAGNQLFTCVTPTFQHIGEQTTLIELEIDERYRTSVPFFWMTRGAFVSLPRLVGAGDADVELAIDGHVGTFRVRYQVERRTVAGVVRRWASSPLTARKVARELQKTNEQLHERYYELEEARTRLDRQATRLRTAHKISTLIVGNLDLELTVQSITAALVEEAGFAWARIRLEGTDVYAVHGQPNSERPLGRILETSAGNIGALVVQSVEGADRKERDELLTFVLPTLAMAIQNARAYHELSEYKAGLENLVDQRTRQLQQAHDDLAGTVAQLRDAQAARERFFGNISHEIRTPLSLIVLAAGDIQRRAGHLFDERSRASLAAVTDASRKLVRLVDELLLLAAGQENKLVVAQEPTDIAILLAQLAAAWRPAAEASQLELDTRLPAHLIANVDPIAFERIVSNLVSNAVKYTPPGGRVELVLTSTDDLIQLSVLDTGPGIDPELRTRLFGRFERAIGDDRKKSGTGIGLAIVKQLVHAHGGRVQALARNSGGTELRVTLPGHLILSNVAARSKSLLRTTHAPSDTGSMVSSGTTFAPPGLSAGTILIAEDQPRLAEQVAVLLSEQYTVVVALDGLAAVELVQQHQPQLLITDVDMPGLSGIELARKFRELTGDALAPIIILSAVIDLRTRLAGLEAGAVDYVAKPFDPAELRARVQAQFRMRDLAMRLHRAEQLSALGILTSGLAHELRNPANAIINAIAPLAELLPPELTGPETDAGQLIDAMRVSAEQLAFLVRQLLGLRSNTDLDLKPVDLPVLLQRAIGLAREAVSGVDVRVAVSVQHRVLCAAPLLVQVLANLVENAGHAAGRGGWVEVRAMSTSSESGPRISIEVSDSGPGVAPELRERIFEPFFTTKQPGKGTGLGLSVARSIVHRHQGTLEVQDRGARTAFVVTLRGESNAASQVQAI